MAISSSTSKLSYSIDNMPILTERAFSEANAEQFTIVKKKDSAKSMKMPSGINKIYLKPKEEEEG